jgi:hypothetical protein
MKTTKLSPRMQRFKDAGLLGCFDDTGINSENCKDKMRYREPKADDIPNCQKAIKLVHELVDLNTHVELNIWIGVFFSFIARTVHHNDHSYKDFCETIDELKEGYRYLWEEK